MDGIAWRTDGVPTASAPAEMIRDLDDYRIGWELMQFSRGQRGFWTQWRHRDPIKFAKELARLKREQGVTPRHALIHAHGAAVWFHKIAEFIVGKRLKNSTLTLRRFWGASLEEHEESMVKRKRAVIPIGRAGASKTAARTVELGR